MGEGKGKFNYEISDAFMLRATSLSLKVLDEVSACTEIDDLLRKYYSTSLVSEALFLASPNLHRLTESWLRGKDQQVKNPEKLRHSLLKYLLRMSSRCTPFGLFAGVATGSFSEWNNIRMSPMHEHTLFVRPDMQYLCTLANMLTNDQKVRDKLQFYPNTSLARIGDEYRYIEYYTNEDEIRKYQLQSTGATPELKTILYNARHGSKIIDLADSIAVDGISKNEAREYVNTLIDNQVLVSGLEPTVSGSSFMTVLMEQIRIKGISSEHVSVLEHFNNQMRDLNQEVQKSRMPAFNAILHSVKNSGIKFHEGSLIQADLKLTFQSCELSNCIKQDLKRALPVLMRLSRSGKNSLLDNFRDAFSRRYEMDEIPLSIALDAEAGPGYLPHDSNANSSPLLDGLKLAQKYKIEHEISWSRTDRMLYRKMQDALITGDYEIVLTDGDLKTIPDPDQAFPMSFSALTKLLGRWNKNPEKQLIQLESVGGSSAANLAGRFCYLEPNLHHIIKNIADIEQGLSGETILAEIVHLPQQRTGNILMRPVIRDYEIPYLARSAVDEKFTIPISDLMVSVKQDKVMLRSKRLNKYIMPKLSNAHNYSMGSLAIYRFLCDLQSQACRSGIGFSWGPLENDSIFLPRVVYENIIFQPATWNLFKNEIDLLSNAKHPADIIKVVKNLRSRYMIPQKVVLLESDNELWVDLENINCLRMLQNEIRNLQQATLQEFLFDPDDCIVQSEAGPHTNECVFFIHQNKKDIK